MSHKHVRLHVFLLLVLCMGLVPVPAQARSNEHPLEDSLLLMVYAQQGVLASMPEGTTRPGMPSLMPLADGPINEMDIVINLYGSYLSALQQSGMASDGNVDRLVNGLQEKMGDLQERSARLNARRRRARRGFFGFLRRVGRSLGNLFSRVGRLIGRAAEILIEDIGPEVIKNMVLTGQPLTADVFWHGVRHSIRNRLKSAASNALARKGVPPELIDAVGLPGPDDELAGVSDEDEDGDVVSGSLSPTRTPSDETRPTQTPSTDRPVRYGRTTVAVDATADFLWTNFWTDLPDNDERDCQRTGEPQLDAYALERDLDFNLTFDPDNDEVTGSFQASVVSDPYIDWRVTTVTVRGRVADSWIEPIGDHEGWQFGGTMVLDLTFDSQLECYAIRLTESGFRVWDHTFWTEQADSVQLTLDFYGETFQSGEDGGTYDLEIGERTDEGVWAYLYCYDCALPDDFPPP